MRIIIVFRVERRVNMKNRHNRTLKSSAFLLAACIVLSVAGCSKKNKDENPPLSNIKISNYVGDVSLSENGAASEMKTQAFLSKDNVLTTKENGSVDVQLDDKKMVGLDVNSSAKFTQDGNNNTVELNKGSLYFYTTEKLTEGEKFLINMPSMSIDIRGTSGYIIFNESTGVAKLYLTSGKVHIIGKNPTTGGTNEVDMDAGQSAQLCLFDYLEGSDSVRFELKKVTPNDLPPLLVQKIVSDPEVFARVLEETHWEREEMVEIAESVNVVNAAVEGSENYSAASIASQNGQMGSLNTIFQTAEQAEEAGAVMVGDNEAVLKPDGDGAPVAENNDIPVVNPVDDQPPEQLPEQQPDQQQEDQQAGQKDSGKKDDDKKSDKDKNKDSSKDKDSSKNKDSGKVDSSKDKDSKNSTDKKDDSGTKKSEDTKPTTNGGGGGGGSSSGGGGGGSSAPQSHTISIPEFSGGKVTSNYSSAKTGTGVTLTIQASTGYKLSALSVTGKTFNVSKNSAVSSFDFTMPDEDVSVSATFVQEEYAFSVPESVNGCSVWIVETGSTAETLKSKYFHAGDAVYFAVRLNTGYSLDSVSVSNGAQLLETEESGYSVYTFTMPASNVTASVSTRSNGKTYSVSIEYDDNCNFLHDEYGEVIVPNFSSGCKTSYAAGDEIELIIENPTAESLDNFPLYLYKGSLEDEDFWMEVAYEVDHETMMIHVFLVMPESDVIVYFPANTDAIEPIG